jgi:hypothetical protein
LAHVSAQTVPTSKEKAVHFRLQFCVLFSSNSTARSSFSIRAVSDDDCARNGCAVSNAITARLQPAARNVFMNMSFSFVFDV